MNKTINYLLLILISFSACNSADEKPYNPEDDGYIKLDYITDYIPKNYFINDNDEVYSFGYKGARPKIIKVNQEGEYSNVVDLDYSLFGPKMGIAQLENENLYYVTSINSNIYNYSINSSSFNYYSLPSTSRIYDIEKFNSNTFIIFDADYSNNTSRLRKYFPNSNSTEIIAGSNLAVIDGIGENASFKLISRMLIVNEIIYVIDDYNNLRKIEKIGDEFIVTTLISEYDNNFKDIEVDANGNILVLVDSIGILKLNNSNNSLEDYLVGDFKYYTEGMSMNTGWNSVSDFGVHNNDLYLSINGFFIKISNYETKLN